MHEAFRSVLHYGHKDARPVICLHGMGGGTKFAELAAKRWNVYAICPIAMSGKAWLTNEEMLRLAFPGGDAQDPVLEIMDGVADLIEEYGAEWIAGHSQGACLVAEGVATGAWQGLKGAAMSCGALPCVAFDRERYDETNWPAIYMGWHSRDPVFRKVLGSTRAIHMTKEALQEWGADVCVRADSRRSHAPIWPDAIKEALAA